MSNTTLIDDIKNSEPELFRSKIENLNEEELRTVIFEFPLEETIRIKAIERYDELYGTETVEIVNKLNGCYQLSGTKLIENYLYKLCTHSSISAFLKLEVAKSLLSFDESLEESDEDDEEGLVEINNQKIIEKNKIRKERGYKALDYVCYDLEGLATPCKIEAVFMLMCSECFKNSANSYFLEIISDDKINCDYRYKTILSLEKRDVSIPDKSFFVRNACLTFIFDVRNMTMYRILSSQLLLQKYIIGEEFIENRIKVENILLTFAMDNELDYNLRADAADTLLSLGSGEQKSRAREIILLLGRVNGEIKTVFDNAQNVHSNEIETSVINILEFLSSIQLTVVNGEDINFPYVNEKIENMMKAQIVIDECKKCSNCNPKPNLTDTDIVFCSEECNIQYQSHSKIRIAMNRIFMDRVLYSKFNSTLVNIILKIWTYITQNKHEDQMKARLLQELEEMSGTCTSGYATRLVNVLSGYDEEFSVRISWEDQIIANVSGRLNARVRKISEPDSIYFREKLRDVIALQLYSNEDIRQNIVDTITSSDKNTDQPAMNVIIDKFLSIKSQDDIVQCIEQFSEDVISEMSLPSSQYRNRQNFLLFFRSNMSSIRQEMYEEFKTYISDNDYDLYFRKAIFVYEGENY